MSREGCRRRSYPGPENDGHDIVCCCSVVVGAATAMSAVPVAPMNSTTVGSCCCVWAVTRGVRGCPLLPALIDGTREMATNIYTAQAAARPRNKVARMYVCLNLWSMGRRGVPERSTGRYLVGLFVRRMARWPRCMRPTPAGELLYCNRYFKGVQLVTDTFIVSFSHRHWGNARSPAFMPRLSPESGRGSTWCSPPAPLARPS